MLTPPLPAPCPSPPPLTLSHSLSWLPDLVTSQVLVESTLSTYIFLINLFIFYLFIFGCVGSPLLCAGFL